MKILIIFFVQFFFIACDCTIDLSNKTVPNNIKKVTKESNSFSAIPNITNNSDVKKNNSDSFGFQYGYKPDTGKFGFGYGTGGVNVIDF